jgi:hypothetical protein
MCNGLGIGNEPARPQAICKFHKSHNYRTAHFKVNL